MSKGRFCLFPLMLLGILTPARELIAGNPPDPPVAMENLAPSELPSNLVVDTLFSYFLAYRDLGTNDWYYFVHHQLEIVPGTPCERILAEAARQAREVKQLTLTPNRTLRGHAFEQQQINFQKAKARRLGRVYWQMRRDSDRQDCHLDAMDRFMESVVRPSISVQHEVDRSEPLIIELIEQEFLDSRNDVDDAAHQEAENRSTGDGGN